MFFNDPTATFANVRGAMKPGGRLALGVFRGAAENAFSVAPFEAVRHLLPGFTPPGTEGPGMFSWSDPDHVRRILDGAGFHDVSLTPLDPVMRFAGPGGVAEAAGVAMLVGPVSRALAEATADQREAVRTALVGFFRQHDGAGGITLPAALWVVQARV